MRGGVDCRIMCIFSDTYVMGPKLSAKNVFFRERTYKLKEDLHTNT